MRALAKRLQITSINFKNTLGPGQNGCHLRTAFSNAFPWLKVLYFDQNLTEFLFLRFHFFSNLDYDKPFGEMSSRPTLFNRSCYRRWCGLFQAVLSSTWTEEQDLWGQFGPTSYSAMNVITCTNRTHIGPMNPAIWEKNIAYSISFQYHVEVHHKPNTSKYHEILALVTLNSNSNSNAFDFN